MKYEYHFLDEKNNIVSLIGGSTSSEASDKIIQFLKGSDITWFMVMSEKYSDHQNTITVFNILVLFFVLPGLILYIPTLGISLSVFCVLVFLYLRSQLLYVFGDLGGKIQKLSQQIAEVSGSIKSSFGDNPNYNDIRTDFTKLSLLFRNVSLYVIRLEKIEKKIQKGNLFPSEKYINSLRSDIIEPLKSLKLFLEKQREELEKSQEELRKIRATTPSLRDTPLEGNSEKRVRVGGDPETSSGGQTQAGGQSQQEGQEQALLASKRTEPIIQELTENIAKLDEMIGKMG